MPAHARCRRRRIFRSAREVARRAQAQAARNRDASRRDHREDAQLVDPQHPDRERAPAREILAAEHGQLDEIRDHEEHDERRGREHAATVARGLAATDRAHACGGEADDAEHVHQCECPVGESRIHWGARLTQTSERSTAATPLATVMPSTARRLRPASTQPVSRLETRKPSSVAHQRAEADRGARREQHRKLSAQRLGDGLVHQITHAMKKSWNGRRTQLKSGDGACPPTATSSNATCRFAGKTATSSATSPQAA